MGLRSPGAASGSCSSACSRTTGSASALPLRVDASIYRSIAHLIDTTAFALASTRGTATAIPDRSRTPQRREPPTHTATHQARRARTDRSSSACCYTCMGNGGLSTGGTGIGLGGSSTGGCCCGSRRIGGFPGGFGFPGCPPISASAFAGVLQAGRARAAARLWEVAFKRPRRAGSISVPNISGSHLTKATGER